MKKGITITIIILGVAAVVWFNIGLFSGSIIGLPAEVKSALKSNDRVAVTENSSNGWLAFEPTGGTTKGIIFYPEGRMDPRTYAPVSQRLAENGYLVVFLSRRGQSEVDQSAEAQRIQAVLVAYPYISQWALGAHTWGVNSIVGFVNQNPEAASALVLWAPRLNPGLSIADTSLPTLVIYGTLDEENTGFVEEVKPYLPAQAEWVQIEGGNRVSFASFGPMAADVGATISEAEQQNQAIATTLDFLETTLP